MPARRSSLSVTELRAKHAGPDGLVGAHPLVGAEPVPALDSSFVAVVA